MSEEQKDTNKKSGLVLMMIFTSIIFTITFIPQKKNDIKNLQASALDSFTFSHSEFEKTVFSADIVYVENLETGKPVYQKKANLVKPLASLTKIMTTYSALSLFPENASVTIENSDLLAPGDHGLVPGEVWDLKDLLVFMLITSSNDAALAIEREALKYTKEGVTFPDYMTKQAFDLGFDSLSFKNGSGLDLDEEEIIPSALGSAEDITKLFSLAYEKYQNIFDKTKHSRMTLKSSLKTHNIENTNVALHSTPGILGSKTGYTNTAKGNLSVITNIKGVPHIVTVLHSTRSGRFEDIQKIISLTGKE